MTFENNSPSCSITATDVFVQEWERGSPFQTQYDLEGAIRRIIEFETSQSYGELEQIKDRILFIESVLVKILAKEMNTLGDLNSLASTPGCYNQFVKLEQ